MSIPSDPIDTRLSDDEAVALWGRVIKGFHTASARLHGRVRAELDLNEAETEAVLHLDAQREHRAPMAALARAASFTSGGFTKIADRLVARGVVARVACADDRRVTFLELTPEGTELATRLRRLVAEVNRAQFVDVLGYARAVEVADAMYALHRSQVDLHDLGS